MPVNKKKYYWRVVLTLTPFYKDFGDFINKAIFGNNGNINGGMFIINQIFQGLILGISGILNLNNILKLTNQIFYTFALIFSKDLISNIEKDISGTFNITLSQWLTKTRVTKRYN